MPSDPNASNLRFGDLPAKARQILEAALQEFLAHGYAATTMDRVAAKAGVSKPTVYGHFQSKENLFATLVERLAKDKYQAVFSPDRPQVLQADAKTFLRHIATNILDTAASDPDFLRFMRLLIGESGRFPKLAQPYLQSIVRPALSTLTQYFASRPELNLPDPEATAWTVLGTLVYFVVVQKVLSGAEELPMERDRLIDNLIALITNNSKT